MSVSLLFGGLAITIMTVKNETDSDIKLLPEQTYD